MKTSKPDKNEVSQAWIENLMEDGVDEVQARNLVFSLDSNTRIHAIEVIMVESLVGLELETSSEFDYIDNDEVHSPRLFRFKNGMTFDLGNIMYDDYSPWDGREATSAWTGVRVAVDMYDRDYVIAALLSW